VNGFIAIASIVIGLGILAVFVEGDSGGADGFFGDGGDGGDAD
jgi:hypothetical protein